MDITWLKDTFAIVGIIVAFLTFLKALSEYRRQGTIRRIEFFLEARKRLKGSENFQKIINLLEKESPDLKRVDLGDKIQFVGFFEEIALLVNSKVVDPKIANYMFGYYARKCWNSQHFWELESRPEKPLDKWNDPYWVIFRSFIELTDPVAKQLETGGFKGEDFVL